MGEQTLPPPRLVLPAAHVVPATYEHVPVVSLQQALAALGGQTLPAEQELPMPAKTFGLPQAVVEDATHEPLVEQHAPLPTRML